MPHEGKTSDVEMSVCTVIGIGDVFDCRFKVQKVIGRGGFGAVYQVVDLRDEQSYAMKIELYRPRKHDTTLLLEIEVLKRLQANPHFGRYICNGKFRGLNYLVMQLVGVNLLEIHRSSPHRQLTPGTAVRVALQCLDAVEAVHAVSLLHRDIKPGNFLVGATPDDVHNVYLIDFGLVRRFRFNNSDIRPERPQAYFRGTLKYASPRILMMCDAGRCDDLCSWIYTFAEIATGRLPWTRLVDTTEHRRAFDSNVNKRKLARLKIESKFDLFARSDFEHDKCISEIYDSIMHLRYQDKPPYAKYRDLLTDLMLKLKVTYSTPYDWEAGGANHNRLKFVCKGQDADVEAANVDSSLLASEVFG